MKNLIVLIVLACSLPLYAVEKVICVITNDQDSDVSKFVYDLNEETQSIAHLYKDKFVGGRLVERLEMSEKDLKNGGIILSKQDKYIISRIESDNFDREQGGVLRLDTLHNGVNGDRKEYVFEISKTANGFEMFKDGKAFDKMFFKAKKSRVFGVVGIDTILFSK